MTNAEYIRNELLANDNKLAELLTYSVHQELWWKIHNAFDKAMTNPLNEGNVIHAEDPSKNPSVWVNEKAYDPNKKEWINNYGRPEKVGILVWLSKQYNPKDWEEN